ncbi:MAG: FKBP-type peptidyl-prolyl cis-trans isomerase [Bacteroidaceae bacterium]|nr:FKBP-type peptidyl-prolyl cis-trans isomerase [Bacteroidaceae bacterium]
MKPQRLPIVALLGFSALLFASCANEAGDAVVRQPEKVVLANADDSLSFAVSTIIARDMPMAIKEFGIEQENIDDFVNGICAAFPVDSSPRVNAFAHGVAVAIDAVEMLESAQRAMYQSDTTIKVDRRLFLEGLKAMAKGNREAMSVEEAYEYYNRRIFCRPSEEFMKNNAGRRNVQVLPSGVQVKVERVGNGKVATYGSKVGCIYKASFINGRVFESSRGEVVELRLGNTVPGLDEVLKTFPAGTACKVYIPWQLAYGARGSEKVPPYSALVYDLEIVRVIK